MECGPARKCCAIWGGHLHGGLTTGQKAAFRSFDPTGPRKNQSHPKKDGTVTPTTKIVMNHCAIFFLVFLYTGLGGDWNMNDFYDFPFSWEWKIIPTDELHHFSEG